MTNKVAANKKKTTGKPHRWQKGESGNPAGRPKDGESWAAIIKAVGDWYPADLLAFIGKDNDLGRMLATLPQAVQMKYLTTIRVFTALMFEPTAGLWKELMERVEGKITSPVDVTSNGETLTDTKEIYDSILRKLGLVDESAKTDAAESTEPE